MFHNIKTLWWPNSLGFIVSDQLMVTRYDLVHLVNKYGQILFQTDHTRILIEMDYQSMIHSYYGCNEWGLEIEISRICDFSLKNNLPIFHESRICIFGAKSKTHSNQILDFLKQVRFVVLGNLFCSEHRIHRRFDLKGSSYGRTADKTERDIDETTTLKDLDLNFLFHLQHPYWEDLLMWVTFFSWWDLKSF